MPPFTLSSPSDHSFLSLSPSFGRFKPLAPPRLILRNPNPNPNRESPSKELHIGTTSSLNAQFYASNRQSRAGVAKSEPKSLNLNHNEPFSSCPDGGSASFASAHHPFDESPQRRAAFYAATIGAHCRSQRWEEAVSVFASMLEDGAAPDKFLVPKILKACSELRNGGVGACVHGFLVRAPIEFDVFVGNSLIDMYAKCGDLASAQAVFGQMPERDVVSWTALVNAYSDAEYLDEASRIFNLMLASGVKPDLISWNALISGFARNGDIDTALCLLDKMCADRIKPGTNTWNGVISGCVQNGLFDNALDAFSEMCLLEKPNGVTIASILPACSGLHSLNLGRELHGYVIRNRIKLNVFVGGSLIDMYLKCGKFSYAERVFSELESKNSTVWNEMIAAYADEDNMSEALKLFRLMQEDGSKPDVVTYNVFIAAYAKKCQKEEVFNMISEMGRAGLKPNVVSVNSIISGFHHCYLNVEVLELFRSMQFPNGANANSCSSPPDMLDYGIQLNAVTINSVLLVLTDLKLLHLGKEVHSYVLRNGFESNIFISSTLVDMYAKCGNMVYATIVFNGIKEKNSVSWNILIAGYNHNGEPGSALNLFPKMLGENIVPNSITLMILLFSCSIMMALNLGKELHGYIEKTRPNEYPVTLACSLIDMYAKCGSIKDAKLVFDTTVQKDIAVCNAMMTGYSLHKMPEDAVNLFQEIELSGLKPDHITFSAFLSALNQEGFVEEARKYFNSMVTVYAVSPTLEHFTCMIDIVGTAGLLKESLDIIASMPFEPDACVWATLLKACRLHSNHEIGAKAAEALFQLEPRNASNYIVLSNIYAMSGMWDSAARVRDLMKDRGLNMVRQCSQLYVGTTVHSFKAGDRSHCEIGRILNFWRILTDKMMKSGYVPLDAVFCNEGQVDPFTCYHTEKLAICFGLISTSPYSPIHVSKNIRMCMDCHYSAKFISRTYNREIVVSDGCSYHYLQNGVCSCRDKW
ncbi:pentatricopeptide repeat-containing protein At2g02980, chloroplastic-like [Ananas comosus]|uniref:Pentatricopeptide repeat-containing protein At2g02980, chloroplastic-like n=1 Tax=Ananas comosus TaxID=4615 RepID=A0A6P5FNP5_ANACO|nr:pentatricopeptide repeat-containing protein At2g02980, chloroplastic-like [Ananas comosus]